MSKKKENNTDHSIDKFRIFNTYLKDKEDFDDLAEIIKKLKQKHNLNENLILEFLEKKDEIIYIPLSIFKCSLAPLEAVVLFLKDILNQKFSNISIILNRNPRTIWYTYNNAKKKNQILTTAEDFLIPVTIFSERKYSVLESLVNFLKNYQNLTLKEISDLIDKNPKTVWTVYNRFQKKKANAKK